MSQVQEAILSTHNLSVTLNKKGIVAELDIAIPAGSVSCIIGPNGCGKSTTLKAMARMLPYEGSITFQGAELRSYSSRRLAKQLAILTQSPQAPLDLTVGDLVERGRFPHRSFLGRTTAEDREQVAWALAETNLASLRGRLLSTLSGGERQRAWIAMALAQRPQLLFLDEPTTYLDISHQLEVMSLIRRLNRELGLTIVMVLHDINQVLRYSQQVYVIKDGRLVAAGEPEAVITVDLLRQVYGVEADEFTTAGGRRVLLPREAEGRRT